MTKNIRELFESQDWPYIIKDLTYYAYSRFKFWNLLYEKSVKGYSPEEIAYQAIEMVLTGAWSWDPEKSDLLPYLKFHVVKGLVANLARNAEVKQSDDKELSEINSSSDKDEEAELNARQIIELINEELKEDEILFKIFSALYDGLNRRDICKTIKIDTKEYDNHIRRLKTRLLKMENAQIFDSLKRN